MTSIGIDPSTFRSVGMWASVSPSSLRRSLTMQVVVRGYFRELHALPYTGSCEGYLREFNVSGLRLQPEVTTKRDRISGKDCSNTPRNQSATNVLFPTATTTISHLTTYRLLSPRLITRTHASELWRHRTLMVSHPTISSNSSSPQRCIPPAPLPCSFIHLKRGGSGAEAPGDAAGEKVSSSGRAGCSSSPSLAAAAAAIAAQ